jgi:hypothetical protein
MQRNPASAIWIVLVAAVAGCASPNPPQPAAPATTQSTSQAPTYAGGDGSSLEHAVVINGAKGESDGVQAEYVWLRRHYPTHRLLRQAVKSVGGRMYDQMDMATPEGERSVFFDITAFYGK